jgi:hypothetical protein
MPRTTGPVTARDLLYLNEITVTDRALMLALDAIARVHLAPTDDPDTEAYMAVLRRFAEPDGARALWMRIAALRRALADGAAPGWVRGHGRRLSIAPCLIAAAAAEPLLANGDHLDFDRAALLRRAVRLNNGDSR